LTVTYMNRKPSEQIDTLEQRARAFGYRGDQLSYCQFFASHRTVKILETWFIRSTTFAVVFRTTSLPEEPWTLGHGRSGC
jgi:hypothetical protein